MAKDKSELVVRDKKEKKEKKDKKRKLEEGGEESAKKDKKKRKSTDANPMPVDDESIVMVDGEASVKVEEANGNGADSDKKIVVAVPLSALVPFANPLCDDKAQKKVLKNVKKAAKAKALKRGVKECVKAIRKSPPATPAALASGQLPNGIVILAADISPMDVISHIPVLCEDHNIPYVYVPSRAELGAAGATKRPTSVVMLTPAAGKKAEDEQAVEEWQEAYKELHKLAVKLGQHVKV